MKPFCFIVLALCVIDSSVESFSTTGYFGFRNIPAFVQQEPLFRTTTPSPRAASVVTHVDNDRQEQRPNAWVRQFVDKKALVRAFFGAAIVWCKGAGTTVAQRAETIKKPVFFNAQKFGSGIKVRGGAVLAAVTNVIKRDKAVEDSPVLKPNIKLEIAQEEVKTKDDMVFTLEQEKSRLAAAKDQIQSVIARVKEARRRNSEAMTAGAPHLTYASMLSAQETEETESVATEAEPENVSDEVDETYTTNRLTRIFNFDTVVELPGKGIYQPLLDAKYERARQQPKSPEEEDRLAEKYAAIPSVGDRAYQILLDLGMI